MPLAGLSTRDAKTANTPPEMSKILKIGTRASPLAIIQTARVEAALLAAHPGLIVERVLITTSGDWKPTHGETRLSEVQGGKGLFAREIERALLAKDIDCAVHSLKDMPSFLDPGLVIDHVIERADPHDAFISHHVSHYRDLPVGAVVGTSSLRRQAFVLSKRPDLKVVPLRGNVQTRLEKLKEGLVDATFLAQAGLDRLEITGDFIHPLNASDMLPACAQGVIGIETRDGDLATQSLLDPIHHDVTGLCSFAERAALQVLDGSCHTPIGSFARFEGGEMVLELAVSSLDGVQVFSQRGTAVVEMREQAETLGWNVATDLKKRTPSDLYA